MGRPIFCPHCGDRLEDTGHFCANCGTEIKDVAADFAVMPVDTQVPASPYSNGSSVNDNRYYAEAAQKESFLKDSFTNTHDRMNRKAYIIRLLIWGAINFVLYFIGPGSYLMAVLSQDVGVAATFGVFGLICSVIMIISIIPNILAAIRRLHDLNHSGWMYLLFLIPIVNFFFGLYLLFARGTYGDNSYGPDPLQALEK